MVLGFKEIALQLFPLFGRSLFGESCESALRTAVNEPAMAQSILPWMWHGHKRCCVHFLTLRITTVKLTPPQPKNRSIDSIAYLPNRSSPPHDPLLSDTLTHSTWPTTTLQPLSHPLPLPAPSPPSKSPRTRTRTKPSAWPRWRSSWPSRRYGHSSARVQFCPASLFHPPFFWW